MIAIINGEVNNFSERSERAGEAKPEGSEHCKNSLTSRNFSA
jgi:hypothetical protein